MLYKETEIAREQLNDYFYISILMIAQAETSIIIKPYLRDVIINILL